MKKAEKQAELNLLFYIYSICCALFSWAYIEGAYAQLNVAFGFLVLFFLSLSAVIIIFIMGGRY